MPENSAKDKQMFPHVSRLEILNTMINMGIPNAVIADALESHPKTVVNWHQNQSEPRAFRPRRALDNIGLAVELLEKRDIPPPEMTILVTKGIETALEERRASPSTSKLTLSPIAEINGLDLLMLAIDKELHK